MFLFVFLFCIQKSVLLLDLELVWTLWPFGSDESVFHFLCWRCHWVEPVWRYQFFFCDEAVFELDFRSCFLHFRFSMSGVECLGLLDGARGHFGHQRARHDRRTRPDVVQHVRLLHHYIVEPCVRHTRIVEPEIWHLNPSPIINIQGTAYKCGCTLWCAYTIVQLLGHSSQTFNEPAIIRHPLYMYMNVIWYTDIVCYCM